MKKLFLLLALYTCCWTVAQAQLPPGSIAPNFTGTDLNGNTYNLYDLLDQGKTVYMDMFATWCGPCWNYHNSGALESIYNQYGPPGTNEAMVLAIECDNATNTACLYGPSGCVGGTQGNWVGGSPYPFIDDASIGDLFNVNYYPTIYMICPQDHKIWEPGQQSATGLWNYRASHCAASALSVSVNNVKNVKCFGSNTGAIDINVSGSTTPYTYNWSNGSHLQDLNNIPAGIYTCTVTSGNLTTEIVGPITVEGPPGPITISLLESVPAGCNGLTGSLSISANGGWGNYDYHWNNGQVDPIIAGLTPGAYTVTVTDEFLCTKTFSATVAAPTLPIVSIAPPALITCAQSSIQLNGTGSSSGPNFTYEWFASSGGVITAGINTLTPTVASAGTYSLQVVNTENTCEVIGNTFVQANVTPPTANAGAAGAISCTVPTVVLQGSGSSGANFTYLWTASNGGNIASGASTLSPTVTASGTYTLKVTNTTNGCTQTSSTTVTGSAQPALSTSGGAISCTAPSVTLNTTTSAGTPVFAWTGPNGFSSSIQSPTVNTAGDYTLVMTDQASGCTATTTASVAANNAAPGASASGGTLTCTINNVTLNSLTPSTNGVYAWTGPGGFNSNLQNPSVNTAGQYTVVVSDTLNGCTSTASASVALNNTNPAAAAVTPGNLNCSNTQIQLNGANSSQGPNFAYAWTTTGGNIVSGANTQTPLVDQPGAYSLLVTNSDNGCTAVASTTVIQNQAVATSTAQANVSCNGATNGTASVTSSGGNGIYSYSWSNGATTASISNLAAGTYIAVVTDSENCSATASVSIGQPDVLAANASATAQSANGVNDGTATLTPLGGTAGYTYLWSNNETTQTISNLAPGSYTVSVTDANGCTALQTVTVNAFNCALSASVATTNISCFGANNGAASATLTGAANPVTYIWSNGETSPTVANLAPGAYTVNIMDGNNCPAQLNVSIAEPAQVLANAVANGESAAGANDGSASATPNGGSGTFTYLWSNTATTQTITGLAPGAYTVTVFDLNGCTSVQTVAVNAFNCAVSAQTSIGNVSCAGAFNGTVTVAPTGAAPFNYAWSNGANMPTISNLAGGAYTATITDANGCQLVTTAEVIEPTPFSPWTVETTNPVCPAEATGVASATISGGTAPYTYLWSNGATSNVVNNLVAGDYTLVATDINGCQSTTTVVLTASDNEVPTISVQNATIALNNLGLANVTPAALSANAADNCSVAITTITPNQFDCDQLGEHEVTVVVTDASGLTASATAIVTVVDNQAPVVTCPNSITACSYDNIVAYDAPVALDNCLGSANGQWKLETGFPSGAEFPVGVTTQKYTYTDGSGNVGSCSFEVIITPPVVFNAPVVTNDVNGQGVGSVNVDVSGGNAPLSFEWTRESQVVGTTQTLTNVTEGTYTLVVTDASGCTYAAGNIVVSNTTGAKEPTWLTGVRLQPNPTSGIMRIVFAQTPSSTLEISVIDATGRIVLTQVSEQQYMVTLDGSNLPQGIYTLRFRTGEETGVRKLVINR